MIHIGLANYRAKSYCTPAHNSSFKYRGKTIPKLTSEACSYEERRFQTTPPTGSRQRTYLPSECLHPCRKSSTSFPLVRQLAPCHHLRHLHRQVKPKCSESRSLIARLPKDSPPSPPRSYSFSLLDQPLSKNAPNPRITTGSST